MNSPNPQSRQFIHNTCDLSIDDKKSPFPAWMKFNKPNPLRFSLSVQDPDRPELEPMRVSGDRNKLEALHQTIEDYVKDLLIRAPLPQLNGGEDAGKLPRQSRSELGSSSLSSGLDGEQKRPIDALNVVDDRPRIEADGLSRHLFYLGSGADANTSVMSLSTLQLFDLSSALSEGLTPVAAPEIEAVPETIAGTMAAAAMAAETTDTEKIVEPVVLPQETVTNNKSNNSSLNSVATPLKSEKPDLEEPRVVLPSARDSDSIDSGDLYGLETESSILERSTPSRDRFKMPKPSLGSLNLPELPDFSRSPLTSIPLWLGLGGMASLIIGFPFISGYFKTGGAVSKKPATPTTQVASAPANEPPAYQPTNPSLPIGVGTPSINGLPSPSSTLGNGAGGLTTQFSSGNPGSTPVSPVTGSLGNTPGGANPSSNDVINRQRAINAEKQRQAAAKAAAGQNGNGTSNLNQNNGKIAQGTPTEARPPRRSGGDAGGASQQARGSVNPDLQAPVVPSDEGRLQIQRGSGDSGGESGRSRGRRQPKPAVKKPPVAERSAPSAEPDIVIGRGTEFDGNESGQFRPVEPAPRNSTLDIEPPANIPSESVQTRGLQSQFRGRWKGDPNFKESLEYQVNVGKNGRVISVEGRTEYSRVYLSKTGFLKPGDQVSKNGQQDQKIFLILHPTGEVEALADSE